jgi:undecaprenyl-diphosphatase
MSFLEILQSFLKYILLGIVQGITEVLPISSSGHVTIAQIMMRIEMDEGILFLVVINLGSMVAIVWHFRKFIFRLIKNFVLYIFKPSSRPLTTEDFLYCLKIALASVPIGLTGFLLDDLISSVHDQYPLLIVGIGLLITGTFLFLVRNASYVNSRQKITFRDAMVIGFGQMFAPVPGLSRSGITTSSGLLRKLSMETVLVFSFMLYIPVSLGSVLKNFMEWGISPTTFDWGFDPHDGWSYLYYLSATVFSYFATRFSIKYVFVWFRRGKLIIFSIYTFVLGLIVLLLGLSAS